MRVIRELLRLLFNHLIKVSPYRERGSRTKSTTEGSIIIKPNVDSGGVLGCRPDKPGGSDMNAQKILAKGRSHCDIENSVQWVLDMNVGDDQSNIRKGNAPVNLVVIKHFAPNFLNKAKSLFNRISLHRLKRMAGWKDEVF